jgi:hypothetical protein
LLMAKAVDESSNNTNCSTQKILQWSLTHQTKV